MTALANPIGVEHGLKYTIVGPDGTRAVLNDTTDADFVGFLTPRDSGGVTGLERANVRENADTLPDADGGVHGIFRRDRLSFTLQGIIPPDTGTDSWVGRQAKLLRATDALASDATLQWTPSSAPAVQVAFRAQQPTRITGARPKQFMVAGVSQDPAAYSQSLNFSSLTPTGAVGGGFSSPLTSPLGSSATATGALVVSNAGSIETWPELTIYGPCSNPSIVNSTNGGFGIYLTYTLASGEYLVINTSPRARSVKLDGTGNRYSAIDWTRSTWWSLLPGNNTLQLGFSSYSSPASLEVRWRDAWG